MLDQIRVVWPGAGALGMTCDGATEAEPGDEAHARGQDVAEARVVAGLELARRGSSRVSVTGAFFPYRTVPGACLSSVMSGSANAGAANSASTKTTAAAAAAPALPRQLIGSTVALLTGARKRRR